MDRSFGRSEITPKNSQKISQFWANLFSIFRATKMQRHVPKGMISRLRPWVSSKKLGVSWSFSSKIGWWTNRNGVKCWFWWRHMEAFFRNTKVFFSQEIVLRNPFGALDRDLYWFTIYPFKIFKSTMHINILQLIHLVNHGCWPNKWVGRWMCSLWHPFQMDDLESRTASGNQMRKCGWKTSLH